MSLSAQETGGLDCAHGVNGLHEGHLGGITWHVPGEKV